MAAATKKSANGKQARPKASTTKVELRPRAALDIESIVVYLGKVQGSPTAAKKLYAQIREAFATLAAQPTIGRKFEDEMLERSGYRTWLVGNYRIFYTFGNATITIWRVVHTSKDIDGMAFIELDY